MPCKSFICRQEKATGRGRLVIARQNCNRWQKLNELKKTFAQPLFSISLSTYAIAPREIENNAKLAKFLKIVFLKNGTFEEGLLLIGE